MIKIRRLKFYKHPILNDLELNFCDSSGKTVDTIILAGENGTGKSTVLNELYNLVSYSLNCEIDIEIEKDGDVKLLSYRYDKAHVIHVNDGSNSGDMLQTLRFKSKYFFNGIFSDVDINFHSSSLSSVTSLNLDSVTGPQRSNDQLSRNINQLLIDIQALDDSELATKYRDAKANNRSVDDLKFDERMQRFKRAFRKIFSEGLVYSRVDNENNRKIILFKKNGIEIPIEKLSSGEKQIVYRGCFLLKDVNALNGGLVFIDEPEISLHPLWQEKILDYYKSIFTNEEGVQTSQVFVVTHSPFIIHNKYRFKDKVIVLTRDKEGHVQPMEKPTYFSCGSNEVVQDAFSIQLSDIQQSFVYVEGETDERYFKRATEVFNMKLPFKFKWIGYVDEKGKVFNTGETNLDKAFHFLVSMKLGVKNICLKDCDTNSEVKHKNNVILLSIPKYPSVMKKGIENALILDGLNLDEFYDYKIEEGDYGKDKVIPSLRKMDLCKYICALDEEKLRIIFKNLKQIIDKLIQLYKE